MKESLLKCAGLKLSKILWFTTDSVIVTWRNFNSIIIMEKCVLQILMELVCLDIAKCQKKEVVPG